MIPYSRQSISESDIRAVVKVLRSPFLTQGPAIASFEKALAKKVGANYCVAFNSGTAALHAGYAVAGVGPGDEVIVPALTFAATANAALYLGAKPVFADVDPKTGLMDIADAERKITAKTKLLVPVDYAGRPAEMHAFQKLARKHKLILLEDGAQSLGAYYRGKPVGAQADMTMFSFHPVKSITTGEGGAITTNSEELYEKMRMFRTHGITTNQSFLNKKGKPAWYMEMQMLGFNYRMTDMQAALGESQLKRLDSFVTKRRAKAERYHALFKGVQNIILPPLDTVDSRSAWHLYTLRLAPAIVHTRDELFSALREKGIGVQVHHIPVYTHPFYASLGYKNGLCPVTEAYAASEISLPLYPDLSAADQAFVARTLKEMIQK